MQRPFFLSICLPLFWLVLSGGQRGMHAQSYPSVSDDQIYSRHFQVTVDGQPVQVMHAAMNLYFTRLEAGGHRQITVTAPTDGYWTSGVEVQPWRLNIRPQVQGRVLRFNLEGTAQITISRPNDFLSNSDMLYVFADPPEITPPSAANARVRFYPAGVYRTNIDARSGDTIYLAPGAVIFGSLNLWQVQGVKVFGRGVIVYDGPQNPADDDGWMHKPNWHCIVMDKAQNIFIEGLTCVVRSRTWQIQMAESHGIIFDNIKVIGANPGNANADGMDWLGGGDTVVRNSFFRAADDVFAMQSSWNGYTDEALADQGHPVSNIVIENTVMSTSISNIVRAAWPRKNFEGGGFTLRDSDVLHMGYGGCGVPFALLEMWADPSGRGQSSGFHFDNVRMEDWYTLYQLLETAPGISDVSFRDVMALEQPARVPSLAQGEVSSVRLDNVIADGDLIAQPADLPAQVQGEAPLPLITNSAPSVSLRPVTGLIQPGRKVRFEAIASPGAEKGLRYTWYFGDGQKDTGRKAKHRFPDAEGTLQDGTGRFRVLLHVSTRAGRSIWLYQPVLVTEKLLAPVAPSQEASSLSLTQKTYPAEDYDLVLNGDLLAPVDGGYIFILIANDDATMTLDGKLIAHAPARFAQVCGLAGNAAQLVTLPAALAHGVHHLTVREHHGKGKDDLELLWQGPTFGVQRLTGGLSEQAAESSGTRTVH